MLYKRVISQFDFHIDTYNVDEHIQGALPLLDELCGIVLCPLLLLIFAEVTREGLLAPVAVARVGDRCKCGDGLVLSGVLQELRKAALARVKRDAKERAYQGQGAMTAHAVTGNADSVRVQLFEGRKESFGEILGNV